MLVNLSGATYQEKSILSNLMQIYLYDLSTTSTLEIDDTGQFPYPYLDDYWSDKGRFPYLVRLDRDLAGFALLKRGAYFPGQVDNDGCGMQVAEFFVMKGYRRQGVGTQAAINLFDRFPGRWEIAQEANNHSGQSFWRKLIGDFCGGGYDENLLKNEHWYGPVQVFNNSTVLG